MAGDKKPIGVAFRDQDLDGSTIINSTVSSGVTLSLDTQPTVEITTAGGDSPRGSQFTVNALAGNGVRQGVINVSINRASGQSFTWDGNPDCGIKISARNRAANAANEGAERGIDISARNSGTNCSWVNGANIGARNDSGSTSYQLIGIQTRLENYGTLETEAVGLDVNMSIENDTGSPVKDAIRVRNTDQSGMTACNSVLSISNTSTNGFVHLLDLDGLTAANGTIVSTSGTAASTFAARLKVKTPDGNSGWINVYSTSNEA